MKKTLLIGLAVVLGLGLTGGIALAHFWSQGGHMGPGYRGHMMGPGYGGHMMGPGYGGGPMMGPGYEGYCGEENPATSGRTKLLTEKETETILKNYIGPNPNLKVGEIKDKGNYFEGEIVTKENSLVSKFSIDKRTGWVQPQY